METLFIPASVKHELNRKKIIALAKNLPEKIAIAYSVQYKNLAFEIKDILSEQLEVLEIKQILGCSENNFSKEIQAILFIGDGNFHVISLLNKRNIPIYIFSGDSLKKLPEKVFEKIELGKKSAYLKFLNSKKIGVLISLKLGQERINDALNLKSKMKNKEAYLFFCNDVNLREFENFPEIECWVNTACPRLDMDGEVINIRDIQDKN